MESFRTLIRGWLGKALLVIFMVPFALVGIEGYFQSRGDQNVAATVNKQSITTAEVDNQFRQKREQLQAKLGNGQTLDETVLKHQILEDLVDQAVIQQQSKKLGFQISDQQITQLIHKEPSFQENGVFSEALFQNYLKNSGQDTASLFAMVRSGTEKQLLQGGVMSTAIATPAELNTLIALQGEKRHVWSTDIPVAPFISGVTVTDKDIATYYAGHKATFKNPKSADISFIVLDANTFSAQATVTDAELQARFQDSIKQNAANIERRAQHILIPVDAKTTDAAAKTQIESLAARIRAGEDFGALAKQFSQDPGSAANNGDLGFAPQGTYVPEFEAALSKLAINQVSAPVKTTYGYHLIKLLEVRNPAAADFTTQKPQLEATLRKEKADALYSDAINKLNELAVDSDSIVELAKNYQLPVQTLKMASRANLGILATPDVSNYLFENNAEDGSKISSGMSISPTQTVWLHVDHAYDSRVQTLEEAGPAIRNTLGLQQATKLARQKADRLVALLKAGKPLADAQQQAGLVLNDKGEIGRDNPAGFADYAIKSIFGLPTPAAGSWTGAVVTSPDQQLVQVVAINAVTPGEQTALPESQRKEFGTMLGRMRGEQDYLDYVHYLRSQAKIVIKK